MDVILDVAGGGRALLRTADALVRQTTAAASISLLRFSGSLRAPLVESVARRLSAIILEPGESRAVALNAAVRSGRSPSILLLPAGFILEETCLERIADLFRSVPSVAAVATPVMLRTPDGLDRVVWTPTATTPLAALTDPRGVPPVFAVRRTVWDSIGGFDETLEGLIEYAFWLTMVAEGHDVRVLDEPLAARELAAAPAQAGADGEQHVKHFRAVLDRHAPIVEREMSRLVVAREVRFGELRELHHGLLKRRDRDLAELDRLRSETAHHRAYLAHHGYEGLDWGDLRRVHPVSRDWGYDRGTPIDRRYIEDFLASHSSDIRGTVLEVQEDDFTRAFGGPRVTDSAVLDIDGSNPRATVLADLRSAPELPDAAFDCVILTQTLHVIDDMAAALREVHRILSPGGVLLATFPAASRVCLEYGLDGDYWRLTPAGVRALMQQSFSPAVTSCDMFGNVLTNIAFLQGLGAGELTDAEYDAHDPYFPALVGVRSKKMTHARSPARGAVLLYHRIDDHSDVHGLGVPEALFGAHMEWLASNCRVTPLDELLTPVEHWPERAIAVTFDDGYEDNLRVASPILQRHHTAAAFFLTSRWLQEAGEYWWDLLERVLLDGSDTPSELTVELAGATSTLPLATAEQRLSAYWRVYDVLVHAPLDERERAVEALRAHGGGSPRARPMVADEVRALARLPGVTIGAHTINHLALPDSLNRVHVELSECRRDLERVVGRPVDVFAYPYGSVDRASSAEVRRLFRWGLSCDARTLGDSFDAARVPRLEVKAWPVEEFAVRVTGLFRSSPPLSESGASLRS